MDPQKQSDDRSLSVPQRQTVHSARPADRDAAAQLMREQIDRLYDDHDINPQRDVKEQPQSTTSSNSLYHQTHSEQTDHTLSEQNSDWNQYHTQWQNYYQQYYERYYLNQMSQRQKQLGGHQVSEEPAAVPAMVTAGEPEPEVFTKSQAVNDLRSQLLDRVKEQAKKVSGSKHFVPIVAAVLVALTFIFLQYNSIIFAQVRAYVSPGSINPANLIVDPTTDTKVSADPRIIIPKINVDAPVVYDVPSIKESIVQEKLKSGVVHYPIPGASAMPGEKGNTVILGHSSNDVFDDGGYKFVFVQLNNLEKGDTFYLNYNGTRYTYSVTEKKVIDPTQVSELVTDNTKPIATLVTCTPPGTALKRLVVIAEQISPDPDAAAATTQTSGDASNVSIPGNSPTLFQRLFGGQ